VICYFENHPSSFVALSSFLLSLLFVTFVCCLLDVGKGSLASASDWFCLRLLVNSFCYTFTLS
jgi:hypothetical protein